MEKEFLEVSTLESKITSELAKENITEKVLVELKAKYGDLKLKSLDDKESYLELKEAAKVCSKVRTAVVKCCKLLREEAVAYQKKCVAKEKEIVSIVSEIEDPIDAEIAKYDAELKRKEEEEKQRKENEYMARTQNLTKMGAVYSNNEFTLGEFSIEANLVKDCSQEVWESDMLPKFQEQYQIIEAERIAEEQRKANEAAELKRKQDELAQKQREFEEQQAAFKKQQEELAQKAREEQLQREKEEFEARQSLINQRASILSALGMRFNGTEYFYADLNVSVIEMGSLNENDWVDLVQKITPGVEQRQKEESARKAEEVAIIEREKIAEQQRQEAIKKQQDEEAKALELAQSNDRTKWDAFVAQLNALVHQEMRSPKYKRMQTIAKEKIEEIINL